MTAKIIEFPARSGTPEGEDEQAPPRRPLLQPTPEMDRELDRELRNMDREHPLRKDILQGGQSIASSNVLRLLRKKPDELLVFCNTLSEPGAAGVPWGDVYCLTDDETYRYLFTLYTVEYVRECRLRRGEIIEASAENIILPVPDLKPEDLTRAVEQWVESHYPGLAGVPVRREDPEAVREMIERSLGEDDP